MVFFFQENNILCFQQWILIPTDTFFQSHSFHKKESKKLGSHPGLHLFAIQRTRNCKPHYCQHIYVRINYLSGVHIDKAAVVIPKDYPQILALLRSRFNCEKLGFFRLPIFTIVTISLSV